MKTFRVHFVIADDVKLTYDAMAHTPEQAATMVRKSYPGCVIIKTKLLKGT